MAKIEGQTGLVLSSTLGQIGVDGNVWIDYASFTISVRKFGSLDDGGVTLQALYSFIMTQWKDNNFEMYNFPMESITPGEFEVRNGWDFADDTTRYLLRDAGWNLLDVTNSTIYEVWMGIQTLGSIDDAANDQVYYVHTADGTPTNFQLPGPVNQAVQIYGDASHGSFDYRLQATSEFVVFLREQGKTYASYNLNVELVKPTIRNLVYAVVIGNAIDLDIEASDAYIAYTDTGTDTSFAVDGTVTATTIDFTGLAAGDRIVISGSASNDGTYTIATWTSSTVIVLDATLVLESNTASVTIESIHQSMTTTWGAISRNIGVPSYDFAVLIDANSGTLQEIYEMSQYNLRLDSDIDDGAGTHIGKISGSQVVFVGPTLKTILVDAGGIYIDNFLVADTNSLVFVDDLGIERTFPYVGAGKIFFNDNLQADGAGATFWMYFVDANGNVFNDPSAIIVKDNDSADITAIIGGVASVDFTFDYEGNVQGGRTANTDAAIVLVAIGSVNAQPVAALGTLTKSTLMSFTLTAAKQRNYVA